MENQIVTIQPGLTAVEQPAPTTAVAVTIPEPVPAPRVYVFNKETIVRYSEAENDSVIIDIVLGIGAEESGVSGTVTKRLVLSKMRLLSDLLATDSSTPVTVVESVSESKSEIKKVNEDKKSVATRMRELAGIPHKDNFVRD